MKMSAGFHRLRRAYFRSLREPVKEKYPVIVMKRRFEQPQKLMSDRFEEKVEEEKFVEAAYVPREFKNGKREVHEQRKRIFIEHIQRLARRRKHPE